MAIGANNPNKVRIILDTNFLLIPARFRVDIFSEIEKTVNFKYELIILDKSLDELKNIVLKPKKGLKGADKEAVRIALSLVDAQLSNKKLNIIPSKTKHVDDAIIGIAGEDSANTVVATQDMGLKKRLRGLGIRIITLRQKKYLTIE